MKSVVLMLVALLIALVISWPFVLLAERLYTCGLDAFFSVSCRVIKG